MTARPKVSGPPSCPSASVMGYGSGLVEVPFGLKPSTREYAPPTFMASLRHGYPGFLFYAEGNTPGHGRPNANDALVVQTTGTLSY